MMSLTPCPFCRADRTREIRELRSPFNGKTYALHACAQCGLEFFTPLCFEAAIYDNERVQGYAEFHQGRTAVPAWTSALLRVMKELRLDVRGKTCLEIGAGDGINYAAFNTLGAIPPEQYHVVELDAKSAQQCRAKGLTHVRNAKFDHSILPQMPHRFDLIFMLEVLEHQTDPKETLRTAFELLRPDGLLLISVPNRKRFFLKYLEFEGDLPPHHFLRFDAAFFRKNFASRLLYLKDVRQPYRIKSLRAAALKFTGRFGLPSRFWWIFAPCMPALHLIRGALGRIQGEGLLVILRKDAQSVVKKEGGNRLE